MLDTTSEKASRASRAGQAGKPSQNNLTNHIFLKSNEQQNSFSFILSYKTNSAHLMIVKTFCYFVEITEITF
jgi:hypothetical protein